MVDPHMDSATFIFGSDEDLEKYMVAYFNGEVEILDEPELGAIALFANDDDDLVHIGRVILDSDGIQVVQSKDVMLPLPSLTDTDAIPFKDAVTVIWVQPLTERN